MVLRIRPVIRNKSFKEICDSAATNILNEGKPVDIFWSGGIDSTVVVISFLNVCTDLSQINIVYDKGGIKEYPLFYEKYVKDVTQEPVKTTDSVKEKPIKANEIKENGEKRDGAKRWKTKKSDSSESDVKERKYFN
jgi:hypothetical protein